MIMTWNRDLWKNNGIKTGLSTTMYYINIGFLERVCVGRVKCTLMVQQQKIKQTSQQSKTNNNNKTQTQIPKTNKTKPKQKTKIKTKIPYSNFIFIRPASKIAKIFPLKGLWLKEEARPKFSTKSCWFWGLCILPQLPLACGVYVWISHQRQPKILSHGRKIHVG